mgnify:CR=1 FL=1
MHMAMAWIWTGMAAVSLIFAAWTKVKSRVMANAFRELIADAGEVYIMGHSFADMDAVGAAALEGAGAAVQLCIAMAGVLCLWSGVMEIMSRCGLSGKLAALLRPALRRLLPRASRDPETLAAVSANVSANLLGLGNAATPLGIRAARRMARGTDGTADDELCRLVVLNTASLQLLPTTVAGVRAACGCRTPFDILPAVWLSSAISVTAGLLAARLLQRVWRD